MSDNIAETFEHAGFTIKLIADQDAEAPDNMERDIFIIASSRHFQPKTPDGLTVEDCKGMRKDYHVLPLYAYIHSGIALSLGQEYPFNCPWDAGQIGYVMVQRGAGFRNIHQAAQSFVETWNQYLSGDVWGYVVETQDGEHLDSCWGFYGLDYARGEAKSSAEYQAKQAREVERMEAQYAL